LLAQGQETLLRRKRRERGWQQQAGCRNKAYKFV